MNDIEKARAARTAKLETEQLNQAKLIAKNCCERIASDAHPGVETVALMIAALAVCDAFGVDRDTAVEAFVALARDLKIAAVFE